MHPGDLRDALKTAEKRIEFLEKQLQAERERTAIERARADAHASTARMAYSRMTGRSRVADDPTD